MCNRCENCKHKLHGGDCRLEFRMASGAAGQDVNNTWDVYFCKDYYEESEERIDAE